MTGGAKIEWNHPPRIDGAVRWVLFCHGMLWQYDRVRRHPMRRENFLVH